MTRQKFGVWCLGIVFLIFAFNYIIMGYGRSWDVDEGQAGIYKVDRAQSLRAAKFMLSGNFSYYNKYSHNFFLSETGREYTYPPLPAILVIPIVVFAQISGIAPPDLFNISILPFVLLSVLAVCLIPSVFEKYTKKALSSDGMLLIFIFLLSGLFFYSVVKAGKFEGVIAFFILLGLLLLPNRKVLSGISFGLAILTKQIAVLFVIPTLFVLYQEGKFKDSIKFLLPLIFTVSIALLPFLLGAGPGHVYIALVKNFDLHMIQKDTVPGYINAFVSLLFGAESRMFETFLQYHINKIILTGCALASLFFVSKRRITFWTLEQYTALMVCCSFLFITFGKWYTEGIYEVAPLYIFVLWAITSGKTTFGGIVLLVESFLVCGWPVVLYRRPLLLLLYFVLTAFVLYTSLLPERKEAVALEGENR